MVFLVHANRGSVGLVERAFGVRRSLAAEARRNHAMISTSRVRYLVGQESSREGRGIPLGPGGPVPGATRLPNLAEGR